MPLSPGTRLGPYEILGALGAGGMGEVYRARDTRLGREAAIKIVSDQFAGDPDRLSRFDREARTLASMNHPHIAQVYGLEESGATHAIAMELVDGEDLRERLARGPIPTDEALAIAQQIADALQAAHEIGIIHRDLKPANIKIRPDGTVKVLDFGLAKTVAGAQVSSGSDDGTNSPTITTSAMTERGAILGTAAYMSPEQARGRPVDRRADMWAFGCVLYEMLTGRRAFGGSSPTDVIAQIITAEPDWTALPRGLPDGASRVVRRCLEKNVQRRLRDAADARLDLEDRHHSAEPGARPSRQRPWLAVAAASVAVGATALAIGVGIGRRGGETADGPTVRSTVLLPTGQRFDSARRAVLISPDGQQLVHSAREGLYLRRLDAFESQLIPGTANAINPAFSPDGRRIAIWTLQGVRSIDPVTGNAAVLRSPKVNNMGILGSLSWSEEGLMLTQGAAGVFLFPPNTADARHVIELAPGEAVSSAQMLPGGDHVLMTLLRQTQLRPGGATGQIVVQSLKDRSRTAVIDSGSDARYVASGQIVYAANGALYAVDFDAVTLRTRGEPSVVVEGVRATNIINATTHYAVSDTGVLAYVPGQPMPPALALDLIRSDRSGDMKYLRLPPAPYEAPRVSPDGRQVATSTDDGTEANIWIHDLAQPSSARKLTIGGRNRFPAWSPDGRRLAFQSSREGDLGIFAQAADGSDAPVRLTTAQTGAGPYARILVAERKRSALCHHQERDDRFVASVAGQQAHRAFCRGHLVDADVGSVFA